MEDGFAGVCTFDDKGRSGMNYLPGTICGRYVIILLLFVSVTLHAPGAECDVLHGWMDRAVAGYPDGAPVRIPRAALPLGPPGHRFAVDGGAAPGDHRTEEIVVVSLDSTGSAVSALRNAWIAWVEGCVTDVGDTWVGDENDLETIIQVPAAKAMGQFPLQAYIREDDSRTGIRFLHPASGALLELITDPTAIASRSSVAGYDGPPVVLILRISAGQ